MTNYEHLMNMTRDELSKFLSGFSTWEDAPWQTAFDEKCKACCAMTDKEVVHESNYAWCDNNVGCRFFPDLKRFPTQQDIISAWLAEDREEE